MDTLLKMLLSCFAGAVISTFMIGRKMESAMYRLDKSTKHVADQAATEYFEAITEKEGKPPAEEACRRRIIALFVNDVKRVKWTWNGELEWEEILTRKHQPLP